MQKNHLIGDPGNRMEVVFSDEYVFELVFYALATCSEELIMLEDPFAPTNMRLLEQCAIQESLLGYVLYMRTRGMLRVELHPIEAFFLGVFCVHYAMSYRIDKINEEDAGFELLLDFASSINLSSQQRKILRSFFYKDCDSRVNYIRSVRDNSIYFDQEKLALYCKDDNK